MKLMTLQKSDKFWQIKIRWKLQLNENEMEDIYSEMNQCENDQNYLINMYDSIYDQINNDPYRYSNIDWIKI